MKLKIIFILVFIACVINYLDRAALGYAIASIEKIFNLTNVSFGLVASAFGIGYFFMSIAGGVLVDKYGARKMWALSGILWSLSCACIGFAQGFGTLFLFRILLGVTEAPAFPAMTRVVADWVPFNKRAATLSLGLAAVPFASVLGAPITTHLLSTLGWRSTFIFLGLIGVLWSILWYLIFRDKNTLQTLSPQKTQTTSWRKLLFNPALIVNNYAFFAFGYLLYFAINWLPGYLEQTYHMKLRDVGWFLTLPWLTATIFVLIGGFLSDWLWKKTHSMRIARSHFIWICQILSVVCFIPVIVTNSLMIDAIWLSLGVGFGLMPNAAFYSLNADLAYDRAATSQGLMNCVSAGAGILAPLVTGWLTNLTGNFIAPMALMVLLTTSSAFAIILFQHPDKKNSKKCYDSSVIYVAE